MKKIIYVIIGLTVLGYIVSKCSSNNGKDNASQEVANLSNGDSLSINENSLSDNPEENDDSNWYYDSNEDKMTGDITYFAMSRSPDVVEFEFPYHGGSHFNLVLRHRKSGNNAYVTVDKGQFIGTFGNETIRVKFDDGPVENYTIAGPDDGSSEIIFFNNSSKFIGKVKKAKEVMIEPKFYEKGRVPIKFNVEGLDWKY